jgi:hypothetical protein
MPPSNAFRSNVAFGLAENVKFLDCEIEIGFAKMANKVPDRYCDSKRRLTVDQVKAKAIAYFPAG